MTTPGGVPNLPAGALTLDTLASKTQDMSGTAMKARAVQRFPSIMNTSTGLDPSLDITPFGILTRIWAEINSLIANADPADIQGPEDLPQLVLQFIEGLPVVGQLAKLLDMLGGIIFGGASSSTGFGEFPIEFPTALNPIAKFFVAIRAFTGLLNFDWTSGTFNLQAVLQNFINAGLLPQEILATVNDLAGLGDAIVAAFNNIPIIGPIVSGVWTVIRGLFTTGLQNSSDIVALKTTVLTPVSGNGFTEEFDGTASVAVWIGWTSTVTGTGSGHQWGIDGAGNAAWVAGTGIQTITRTYDTDMTSEKQVASIVLNNYRTDLNPPVIWLGIRSDPAGTNCVQIQINPLFIRVEAVVAGVVTVLGSTWNNAWVSGDTIDIFGDDPFNNRRYTVKRNGTTIINDAAESSALTNVALRKIKVAARNGNNFFALPIEPSLIKSVSGRDAA